MPFIDQSRHQPLLGLACEAKIADLSTGEIAKTPQGVTKWAITTFLGGSGRSETVRVTVPTNDDPGIVPGQPIEFDDLEVFFWSRDGRSGLAYRAAGVRHDRSSSATGATSSGAKS